MEPIEFKEMNAVLAEGQTEYMSLPVHRTEEGRVISCWKFSFRERLQILWHGIMWFHVLTFNRPLQPQAPSLLYPFKKDK